MKEKYYKKEDNIIIEIPTQSARFNQYSLGEDIGNYPTLIGIICTDENGDEECGFAEMIDMGYKGKCDQWTDIKYHFWGEKEEFIKICEELGVSYFEYPICAYCKKTIYGCFTAGDKGNMCFQCEHNNKQRPTKV
jgi:hypothetical protein